MNGSVDVAYDIDNFHKIPASCSCLKYFDIVKKFVWSIYYFSFSFTVNEKSEIDFQFSLNRTTSKLTLTLKIV